MFLRQKTQLPSNKLFGETIRTANLFSPKPADHCCGTTAVITDALLLEFLFFMKTWARQLTFILPSAVLSERCSTRVHWALFVLDGSRIVYCNALSVTEVTDSAETVTCHTTARHVSRLVVLSGVLFLFCYTFCFHFFFRHALFCRFL